MSPSYWSAKAAQQLLRRPACKRSWSGCAAWSPTDTAFAAALCSAGLLSTSLLNDNGDIMLWVVESSADDTQQAATN